MTTAEHHPDRDLPGLDPHTQHDPLALSELIAAGDIDVVPGDPPVPIAVWRVAGVDAAYGHADAHALSPRMAALLVGSYTRPGETIVCVGDDPALAGAAGAGGRTYRSVRHPDDLPDLDLAAGTVALIVLPWPPPQRPDAMGSDRLIEMFRACRRLMSPGGCTIVALAGLPAGQTYVEHSAGADPRGATRRPGLAAAHHRDHRPDQRATHHLAGHPRRPGHHPLRHPRQDPHRLACLRTQGRPKWLTLTTRMSHPPGRPPAACRHPAAATRRPDRCCR